MQTNFSKNLLVMLLIASCAFAQKQWPKNKLVDNYIRQEMKSSKIPGLAIAVVQNGKIIHCNSYGIANIEYQTPVTVNTNFQTASVTKLFTSSLVMKWLQEKRIDLNDPLSKYIENTPNSWSEIKLKHLLAHESGIIWPSTLGGYSGMGNAKNFKVERLDTLVEQLKDSALVFAPGTKQAYQNGDYFVLQYILEKIGGLPFEQLLKREILSPLKMNDSGYDVEIRTFPYQTMLAIPNKSQNFTKGIEQPLVFKGFYSPASYAAGGLFLSIADAIKWTIALDEQVFLTSEILNQCSVQTPLNGGFTQMGWIIQNNQGHEIIGHSGGPGLAEILRFPKEKLTIIVLSNFADMYAYMAQDVAKIFVKDIKLQNIPHTFDRKLYNAYLKE